MFICKKKVKEKEKRERHFVHLKIAAKAMLRPGDTNPALDNKVTKFLFDR